jgi:hypothetical protein
VSSFVVGFADGALSGSENSSLRKRKEILGFFDFGARG